MQQSSRSILSSSGPSGANRDRSTRSFPGLARPVGNPGHLTVLSFCSFCVFFDTTFGTPIGHIFAISRPSRTLYRFCDRRFAHFACLSSGAKGGKWPWILDAIVKSSQTPSCFTFLFCLGTPPFESILRVPLPRVVPFAGRTYLEGHAFTPRAGGTSVHARTWRGIRRWLAIALIGEKCAPSGRTNPRDQGQLNYARILGTENRCPGLRG